jgi:peptidoglycan/xylan/chitin deacetylase (PgdA/CDA1 family)
LQNARVTLSFDNGPEAHVTPAVLDCLAKHRVQSTFFVLGRKAILPEGNALVHRARAEGHWIGNHTFSHSAPLGRMDGAAAVREIEQSEALLSWVEQPRRLFRPPGSGELGRHLLNPAAVEKLIAGAYTCVLWNSVPRDWLDPEGWLERALADCRSRAWSLVVLHDIPTGAMAHLNEFLERLRSGGVEFVQDFPPECLPIVNGEVVLPMDAYMSG